MSSRISTNGYGDGERVSGKPSVGQRKRVSGERVTSFVIDAAEPAVPQRAGQPQADPAVKLDPATLVDDDDHVVVPAGNLT